MPSHAKKKTVKAVPQIQAAASNVLTFENRCLLSVGNVTIGMGMAGGDGNLVGTYLWVRADREVANFPFETLREELSRIVKRQQALTRRPLPHPRKRSK